MSQFIKLVSRSQLANLGKQFGPVRFTRGQQVSWKPNPSAPELRGTFTGADKRCAAYANVALSTDPRKQAIVAFRDLRAV